MNKDKIIEKIGEYGNEFFKYFSVGYIGLNFVKLIKYYTKNTN